MQRKIILPVVIGFVLIVLLYFGYKLFNLYYYSLDSLPAQTYDLTINETIVVNKKKLNDEDYLVFNNIKIKNDFKGFKKLSYPQSTDEFVKYALYDENNEIKASFWMGLTDTYVNLFQMNPEVYGADVYRFSKINNYKLFEDNNITSDIELFEFLNDSKNLKNDIFTSVREMKNNYAIKYLALLALPGTNGIKLISGDYIGYMFDVHSSAKEVSIIKNDKRYIFTFISKDYFELDDIKDLLNTIIIN